MDEIIEVICTKTTGHPTFRQSLSALSEGTRNHDIFS
jgi:hypothetical protein